jgi:hypothetical protein
MRVLRIVEQCFNLCIALKYEKNSHMNDKNVIQNVCCIVTITVNRYVSFGTYRTSVV